MTQQWPSELKSAAHPPYNDDSFRTEADFVRLMGLFPEGFSVQFIDAANWVAQSNGDVAELERRASSISVQGDAHDQVDRTHLLMTLICAAALARNPSLEMWKEVRALKNNSWQLEHWLAVAMEAYAEGDLEARKAYIILATAVFHALEKGVLISSSERHQRERSQAALYWTECESKLDEIWWGLRRWDFMNYSEEHSLFYVLNKFDSDRFIQTIAGSNNPYFVQSILLTAGVGIFSPKFSQWERFAVVAPSGFEQDGQWNGSVLLPLLLVEAHSQLAQAIHLLPAFDATDENVSNVKREIAGGIESIVNILNARQDALPLFARWTTWLMRQLLSYSEKDIQDVRSVAFLNDALIEEIGRALKGRAVVLASPEDAPAWEAWCYRCVLASYANSSYISPQDSAEFLAEWQISPEEWVQDRGRRLRDRASLSFLLNQEIPGLAPNLLAYPTAQSQSPTEAWIGLWNAIQTLREIVEFGDVDADTQSTEYQSRSEAGRLVLLAFRIGLAILDQRASGCKSSYTPQSRSQAKLHTALATAVKEMREIDDTLKREEWALMDRHLAIRRFIWEKPDSVDANMNGIAIFQSSDEPTFSQYLIAAKSDVTELLPLIQSTYLNDSDISRLNLELRSSSIDLFGAVAEMRRLNQYSARRYPVDEGQLQKLSEAFTNS